MIQGSERAGLQPARSNALVSRAGAKRERNPVTPTRRLRACLKGEVVPSLHIPQPTPRRIPQNGEETAYVSFALIDALIQLLIDKGLLNDGDVETLLGTAVRQAMHPSPIVEHSTEGPHARAASFIRNAMLGKQQSS